MESGIEGGLKVGREGDGGVWRRGSKGRCWEFVEVDVVVGGESVVPGSGLAEVGGCADEVHGNSVGRYEAGEAEKLVEMAVCYERHHYHHHTGSVVAGHRRCLIIRRSFIIPVESIIVSFLERVNTERAYVVDSY